MFAFPENFNEPKTSSTSANVRHNVSNKFKHVIETPTTFDGEMNYHAVEEMLEKEKNTSKNDPWNKLDKTQKIQRLHAFAEKYGKENALPVKEIKHLKVFFVECLDKSKLQKAKDVVYNKETREIQSIPSLHFNVSSKAFTLKNLDAKRVSTLKSLTPKRITAKNAEESRNQDQDDQD
jgi:hypothetical protein